MTAYIGAKYGNFPIDLARELHLLSAPERIRPTPVVEIPGLTELPEIVVYPLTDQVADKVCAMYQPYGDTQSPSTRYRDLIDLALIVSACEFEAKPISEALRAESRRRELQLPKEMTSPGGLWPTGYGRYARRTKVDEKLHTMEAALEHVGHCLNPILDGSRDLGRWRPGDGWCD